MQTVPNFYIVGTKYGKNAVDMLPLMVEKGVVSTGFANTTNLLHLLGQPYESALSAIRELLPNERADASTTLARFLNIRPGDLIALKAHGSPVGRDPHLVISRYAVVKGRKLPKYRLLPNLGHSLDVDYFDNREEVDLRLGYGRTLHHIEKADRIDAIFGAYADAARQLQVEVVKGFNKATHNTMVMSRGEYIMTRAHNELQRKLYERLQGMYDPQLVKYEQDNIDISVDLGSEFLLFEVKASPSPTACIREALGQMLSYAYKTSHIHSNVKYLVVGPCDASNSDLQFIEYIRAHSNIMLIYCTPSTFSTKLV